MLLAFGLLGRYFWLQISQGERFTALAASQHFVSRELQAKRGEIFMRDGEGLSPVAVNQDAPTVYVAPRAITDAAATAEKLSSILGLEREPLLNKIKERPKDPFEIVKKHATETEVAALTKLALPGVGLVPETYRYYPAGELAAKVLGYVGQGDGGEIGAYGIEASQNSRLHGADGFVAEEKDAAGRWIPFSDRDERAAIDGDGVVLTIDRVIQFEVERILAHALERFRADRAEAIVVEPATGKILALAGLPGFDPNTYGSVEDQGRFLNRSISLPYEPGSVMKPITMAMGIEEGKVNPRSEYVDTGSVSEGGFTIRNAEDKVYGRSSMQRVLNESINTGVMYVERLVGNVRFREYLETFGFGTRTGIALPAEHPGSLRQLNNARSSVEFATASFGQGIAVTVLQLAMAYAALANGGQLMHPEIVEAYRKADGVLEPVDPKPLRRVVSEETAQTITTMLRDVVVHGHGKRADVPGYHVVGKTGTAQVAKTGSKGYEEALNIGSFAGYAPQEAPRYVVVVKIDNPKEVEWAESSAAPTFGEIMRFLLEYGKVQPTETVVSPSHSQP